MGENSSSPDRVYLGGVRVLLVDSSPYIRSVVTAMLEDSGATVTTVATAEEALEPDKGGYWLIGKVRSLPLERGGATPAAALTGFTGPEHRASILRAGFQYHVGKPVTRDNLSGIVALLALKAPASPPG